LCCFLAHSGWLGKIGDPHIEAAEFGETMARRGSQRRPAKSAHFFIEVFVAMGQGMLIFIEFAVCKPR